jgi:dTDP-4-amino-4,6-dideoxygalactose transaminase
MTRALTTIPVAKPWLGDEEAAAARRAILSGWVTQGPEVAAFEREFAAAVGAPHACAVSSCTTALHLALVAAGVQPGDEVITASHSFIATANAIRYCGAMPVFVDVQPSTYNMDPPLVAAAVTPRTRAILAVHQLGMPCDLTALLSIARGHDLPLVEDAACAIGSEIAIDGRWSRIGPPHGEIACFSLHPRKLVTTGDGGMLTTRDASIDDRFRLLRQHGMSVPDTVRHASATVVAESYPVLGYNYRLTDIQAAVGREQLARLDGVVQRRREIAAGYQRELSGVEGILLPEEPDWARTNWQSYCLRLAPGFDQRMVMQRMLDRGVSTRRGVMCAHREAAYPPDTWRCGAGCDGRPCTHLGVSESIQDSGLILPLYQQMTDEEQGRVVDALLEAVAA